MSQNGKNKGLKGAKIINSAILSRIFFECCRMSDRNGCVCVGIV